MEQQARIQEMLDRLSGAGIALKAGYDIDDLQFYEGDELTYELLLRELGSEYPTKGGDFDYLSATIWRMDTECIYESGDYTDVVQRIATLTGGALKLTTVEDSVDEEEGEAELSFTLEGERIRLQLQVEGEQVDEALFVFLDKKLRSGDSGKRFALCHTGNQEILVYCGTEEQTEQLKQITQLPFAPLT